MRLVVNVHQLANRSVRIFLRSRKRLVTQQLLNRAEISAIREQVCSKRVPQRVRVQIPIDIRQPHIFFHDAAHGALRQPPPRIIQKHRITVHHGAARAR